FHNSNGNLSETSFVSVTALRAEKLSKVTQLESLSQCISNAAESTVFQRRSIEDLFSRLLFS
ncbi:hypothetical protein, partial [Gelidibacter salicanalis]|uniref:hypothetical protein n=1 Tax=Gelidibacter salicanalis TaxID=291193 RepID=UPI001F296BB4